MESVATSKALGKFNQKGAYQYLNYFRNMGFVFQVNGKTDFTEKDIFDGASFRYTDEWILKIGGPGSIFDPMAGWKNLPRVFYSEKININREDFDEKCYQKYLDIIECQDFSY